MTDGRVPMVELSKGLVASASVIGFVAASVD